MGRTNMTYDEYLKWFAEKQKETNHVVNARPMEAHEYLFKRDDLDWFLDQGKDIPEVPEVSDVDDEEIVF